MEKFRRLNKAGKTGLDLGFVLPNDDTFRFCQRYRVAKSFESVVLSGYSAATSAGYSALFQILLTWSAFERFLKISGRTQNRCGPLLAPYDPEDRVESIRAIDVGGNFYLFLAGQVDNKAHHEQLAKYLREEPFNITYLASAVRHIFAHGSLTAHANHTKPARIKQISKILCDFLLKVMDAEFTKHVDKAT